MCNLGETDGHKLEKTSILKRLSGGDTINAQFKNKPKFVFRNYAKIIVGTNTLPQMQDKTYGNMSRYIIIDFPNRFPEKEDLLNNIPEAEFEALANICVGKLKNLLKNRVFTGEPLPEDKARIYEEKSNPLGKFVADNCKLYVPGEIPTYEFFDRFVDWLGKNGYSVNVNKNVTISEFENRYDITKKQKDVDRFGERKRYYYFDNVCWNNTKETAVEEPVIEQEQEFNKEQMVEYLKKTEKIPITEPGYTDEEIIKLFKKGEMIYEPKSGVYKIQKTKGLP